MIYVIQYRYGISGWTDDILPGVKNQFRLVGDANAVMKFRQDQNPDFQFRVITRDGAKNVSYPEV